MITAIVRFPLTPGTTLDDAKALFEGSAPRYRAAPGLVRKYYLFGEDGSGGGVYLWESREAAERMYTADWKKMIADHYGTPPQITYFETPVIVDNSEPAAADRAA
jgi:hypothetical protein